MMEVLHEKKRGETTNSGVKNGRNQYICRLKNPAMHKRGWLIPVLIVAIHALAILVRWSSLAELLPAHFDLQGNAGGSMSRNMLILYPLAGAAVCLIAYVFARRKPKLQTGLIILASGICLVLLSSTLVSLTLGTMPIFMLAEPVILLLAVIAFLRCIVKARKNNR